jgi:catechol 2,3-dioxygenase-like lactoylglutathione lyase family enzyme
MYQGQHLSPMIPSFDVEKTVSFFTGLLQFQVSRDEKDYVILHKDNCMVHILSAGENIGEMEFYFEVDNVDKLWEDMKDKLTGLKVKGPFNQPYGMREIHIIIPETKTLMFIGQAIK